MLLELALGLLVLALFLHLRPTPTAKSKALRHLPNPPSPKPRLPFIGHLHLLKDKLLHYALIDLSKKHGPLFSLYFGSMPTVVASTPAVIPHFVRGSVKNHGTDCDALVIPGPSRTYIQDGVPCVFCPCNSSVG